MLRLLALSHKYRDDMNFERKVATVWITCLTGLRGKSFVVEIT